MRAPTIRWRCHRPAPRLIHGHLCASCANRQFEAIKNRNRKGRPPEKTTAEMLARRTVSYLAGGKPKSRTIERTIDMAELIVAVLRDEPEAVEFCFRSLRPALPAVPDGVISVDNPPGTR